MSSRINWYEKSEKNSKYFLNLAENARSGQTIIRRLFESKGKLTVNPKSIMNELRDYYQNLHSKQDSDLNEELCSFFLHNNNYIPMLSEQSMMACERKLSLVDCYGALRMFSNGKAPGNDGLTTDFYKGFLTLLGHQLTSALNYSYEPGELSNSQKQAIIKRKIKER